MFIANPIYDTIFKYLMEDAHIARTLIGAIIGCEVVSLEPRPQEHTVKLEGYALTIFRLDYKAIIKKADGSTNKVLIELQKSDYIQDVDRFRRYIGENYKSPDLVDGENQSLPIIAIYILGESLTSTAAFLQVSPTAVDMTTHEEVPVVDEFIRLLTHESYFIQIRRLADKARHRLESLMSVFNQNYLSKTSDRWVLNYTDSEAITDPDLRAIAQRLAQALYNEELLERVIVEEEVEGELDKLVRLKEEAEAKAEEAEAKAEEAEAKAREAEAKAEEERKQKEAFLQSSVLKLHKMGLPTLEIADTLGLSEVEVSRIIIK